jgi:membrane associated rhomboid family serine protease
MNGHRNWGSSEEHAPLTWVRGYPLYAAHFIVAVFVGSMVITTLFLFFETPSGDAASLPQSIPPARHYLDWMPFSSALVLKGQVWRIFTYGLINPPSLFPFVLDMVFMVWFGREVEKFFGRRKFLTLFGCIYLITPLLFTAIGFWIPMFRAGESGALAIFVAFATLYPNTPMMFNVLAKWAALILVGIYTLMALAYHDSATLISLWATCGFAYGFVRFQQGLISLPKLNLWRRKPRLRVLPDPVLKKVSTLTKAPKEDSTMAEVDALLDKIAKSGMSSLTAKERAKLEAAREGLMKRSASRD